MANDLDGDALEYALEQEMNMADFQQAETRANGSSAHSVMRHSGARKYNQEDPIEAAATEMILSKNV